MKLLGNRRMLLSCLEIFLSTVMVSQCHYKTTGINIDSILGSNASSIHKDLLKSAKINFADKSLPVRAATAQCLASLVSNSNIIQTTDMEGTIAAAVKGLEVRVIIIFVAFAFEAIVVRLSLLLIL